MNRLRVLVLAPDANPEGTCGPLLSFSQAEALAQVHDVTLVIRGTSEDAVLRRRGAIRQVEVIRLPMLERVYAWILRYVFKGQFTSRALTAVLYPFCLAFEWQAWRQTRAQINAGRYDVVLRLLPVPAVLPSPFAFFLRKGPIPFVIGPVSGGLPWPAGFEHAKTQKEWFADFRKLYRLLPFGRSTYQHAAAIIAGASQTYAEFASYREKLFFLIENGVSRSLCCDERRGAERNNKLNLIFVGGLLPIKGCDLALRAAAPLLRSGLAEFSIVGDGPERARLEQLTASLGLENTVTFCGWVSHSEAQRRLRQADVLVFPSVRDNSPAVVFEALAAGAVPVVADFGGPGDTIQPGIGYKLPLTNEDALVSEIEKILTLLAENQELLLQVRRQGMAYARERLTWDAKAQALTAIMEWAIRKGPRPNLPPPKMLHLEGAS
jgi:glycosyltransferase involved in cell wall biosynthesis